MSKELYINMNMIENEGEWECLSISVKPTTELSIKVEFYDKGYDNDKEVDYKDYAMSPICTNPLLWKELTEEPTYMKYIIGLAVDFLQENYINILED